MMQIYADILTKKCGWTRFDHIFSKVYGWDHLRFIWVDTFEERDKYYTIKRVLRHQSCDGCSIVCVFCFWNGWIAKGHKSSNSRSESTKVYNNGSVELFSMKKEFHEFII